LLKRPGSCSGVPIMKRPRPTRTNFISIEFVHSVAPAVRVPVPGVGRGLSRGRLSEIAVNANVTIGASDEIRRLVVF
jgi:hypothetical protein